MLVFESTQGHIYTNIQVINDNCECRLFPRKVSQEGQALNSQLFQCDVQRKEQHYSMEDLNSWMGLMIALKATTADCFLRVIAGAPVTEFE